MDSDKPGYALNAQATREFDEFFRSNWDRMIRYVRAKFADATVEDTEDAVSSAMAKLLERWSTPQRPSVNPAGWVYRTAVNNMRNELDRRSKVQRSEGVASATTESPVHGVDHQVLLRAEATAVAHLLDRLPEAQRSVMACLYQGYQPNEIATMSNQLFGTVRSNIRHGRSRLRQQLRTHPSIGGISGRYPCNTPASPSTLTST